MPARPKTRSSCGVAGKRVAAADRRDRGRSPRGRSPGRGGRPRGRARPRRPASAARRRARRSQRAPGRDVELEDLVIREAARGGRRRSAAPSDGPGDHGRARIPTASRRRSRRAASPGSRRASRTGGTARAASRSSAAAKSDASPLAAPAPSSAARPALAAASSWGTVAGSVLRELSVDVRSLGTTATGGERQPLGDPRDPPVPGERERRRAAPRRGCRRAARA